MVSHKAASHRHNQGQGSKYKGQPQTAYTEIIVGKNRLNIKKIIRQQTANTEVIKYLQH